MHVGMGVAFQNPENALSDAEVWNQEVAIAVEAEELGFDSLWTVEHHFTDYTMCPDPVQLLTYLAAKTKTIQLGTGVIVLPWHDPMRVAEQITMLDNLSGGRMILGIGRGLARVEYEGFGVDMNTSRERFVEMAECILTGLEQGYLEYDGELIKQPRRELRPAPQHSFRGRTFAAAVSPESMPIMAKLGIGLLVIPQKPWAVVEEDFRIYSEVYRTENGTEPAANDGDKVTSPLRQERLFLCRAAHTRSIPRNRCARNGCAHTGRARFHRYSRWMACCQQHRPRQKRRGWPDVQATSTPAVHHALSCTASQ